MIDKKPIAVKFNDAIIKRYAKSNTHELKQFDGPLRLRFHKKRVSASWFFVKYANKQAYWHKLGNWPLIPAKLMLQQLPTIALQLAVNFEDNAGFGEFVTVADLLDWYLARSQSNKKLSHDRKQSVKSTINKHLLPLLGDLPLNQISKSVIDKHLLWPLQTHYKVSYVESIFKCLKAAFAQSSVLELIKYDPLSAVKFSDSIKTKSSPKESALRAEHLSDLFQSLKANQIKHQMLVLMMIMHGTRIGETRSSKWVNISLSQKTWFIPADDTKSKAAHRIHLTDQSLQLLQAYKAYQTSHHYKGVYLFPGSKRQAISKSTANNWIRTVSTQKWPSHSLRKVGRTAWADLGIDYMVGEVMLNHALPKLDKTYIHTHVEKQTKQALQCFHDFLLTHGLFFLNDNNMTKIHSKDDRIQSLEPKEPEAIL